MARIEESQKKIQAIQKGLAGCTKHKKPEKCQKIGQAYIQKEQKKLNKQKKKALELEMKGRTSTGPSKDTTII